jgi:hypothetical protein
MSPDIESYYAALTVAATTPGGKTISMNTADTILAMFQFTNA